MNYLTARQKQIRIFELKTENGIKCLFCNLDISDKDLVLEHLDNNPFNNSPENHWLSHSKCNLIKRESPEYQLLAQNQLEFNHKRIIKSSIYEQKRFGNSPEIDHNVSVKEFAVSFLNGILKEKSEILVSDALNDITFLAGEKFGHCSQVTVRRHLDTLCSNFGPFKRIKNNSMKWIIVKRDDSQ